MGLITQELISIIEKNGCPLLASLISSSSPLGALAIQAISVAYGLTKHAEPAVLAQAVQNDPTKAQQIENQHQEAIYGTLATLIEDSESQHNNWVTAFVIISSLLALFVLIGLNCYSYWGNI